MRTLDPDVSKEQLDDVITRSLDFFEFKDLDPKRNLVRAGACGWSLTLFHHVQLFKIVFAGDSVDGMCLVVQGHLKVIDASSSQEQMRIFRKDFFFDVETVFKMASLYDVEPSEGYNISIL